MNAHNVFRNTVRVLATVGVIAQQFACGLIGAGGGAVVALVIVAVWVTREQDPK